MKTRLNILFLIILVACNTKSTDKTIENISADKKNVENISANKAIENISTENSTVQIKNHQQNIVDIKIDTLKVNEYKYIQILKDRKFNCLLSVQGDTIVKSKDYYFKIELIDIDEDGYGDIRVFVFSNTPNQCDNYLFDKTSSSFKLIENCYLDIEKVKGTNFFYSYTRAGCADMDWESSLSKIENYKLVDYGYIYGQGCEFEKSPQIIEIYKVSNADMDKKILIQELPYKKHIKEFGDKWDFVENYWTSNYKMFER